MQLSFRKTDLAVLDDWEMGAGGSAGERGLFFKILAGQGGYFRIGAPPRGNTWIKSSSKCSDEIEKSVLLSQIILLIFNLIV